ncbi:MAG: hypothetical protein OJF59_002017 [Cytophagales bacterium]|jgi:hypothetical protein|nr:hypothetical protein [Bacteroidota bacterium]MBS1980912.1 hypothetical protein [Bacteroidota bacterium]WHZ08264.1 MAG: hypothetical protein OJF59_002017 [Cytophagales bacterium]
MNFSSLKEYFYRLYNYGLIMMLLPMIGFLIIFYLFLAEIWFALITDASMNNFLWQFFALLIFIMLTIVHWQAVKNFKKISSVVGLGQKLEDYYPVIRSKINSYVWASFLLLAGFACTSHQGFSICFGVVILWCWTQWPTPRKVCRQLRLRGDEREMVLTKGEAFRF